ncbi:MAG: hypothetical protein D3906_17020 [Candidatus Electrothrix sp. AUS1_2]|nr:hypothetical protein [Candidatus Electrothrix sp. AUS1_2]
MSEFFPYIITLILVFYGACQIWYAYTDPGRGSSSDIELLDAIERLDEEALERFKRPNARPNNEKRELTENPLTP